MMSRTRINKGFAESGQASNPSTAALLLFSAHHCFGNPLKQRVPVLFSVPSKLVQLSTSSCKDFVEFLGCFTVPFIRKNIIISGGLNGLMTCLPTNEVLRSMRIVQDRKICLAQFIWTTARNLQFITQLIKLHLQILGRLNLKESIPFDVLFLQNLTNSMYNFQTL